MTEELPGKEFGKSAGKHAGKQMVYMRNDIIS